jgi:type IV pilus assembly protein PilX
MPQVQMALGRPPPRTQRGVVLVVALLMLVIISVVATLSVRNATSSEAISGGVRTTQLATQAAEIALRYCEDSVAQVAGATATFVTTFTSDKIQPYSSTPSWQSTTVWDASSTSIFVLPTASVNASNVSTTYARMPECMVMSVPEADITGSTAATKTYVITARGFGPEVAAATGADRRPQGSEVWLQSTIELN